MNETVKYDCCPQLCCLSWAQSIALSCFYPAASKHCLDSRCALAIMGESLDEVPATSSDEEVFDLDSMLTLRRLWPAMWTFVPLPFLYGFAQVVVRQRLPSPSLARFLIEFMLILLPYIWNLTNKWSGYVLLGLSAACALLMWSKSCLRRARIRTFTLGKRPRNLTLTRSTTMLCTALCILAIDFESFPKEFRKHRHFGAGLMDVGIGLFVYCMGSVSQRVTRCSDFKRLPKVVAPLLFLALARTVVITAIDYHQDEHEYGQHLNAFFTLACTKLLGSLLSALTRNNIQLIVLGAVILLLHEFALQMGVSNFVMSEHTNRYNLFTANREGLLSLPGFVSIYLISMAIGQYLRVSEQLNFYEFMHKTKTMIFSCMLLCVVMIISIFGVGIARVTCNFGYAVWMLFIATFMISVIMLLFDLLIDTLWPTISDNSSSISVTNNQQQPLLQQHSNGVLSIPSIIEAVNQNGLLLFLLANILTGGVNIFLKPEDKSAVEAFFILAIYMFVNVGFVYILYCFKIRIA